LTKKEGEKEKKEAPLLSKVKGIIVDLGGESSWVRVNRVCLELRSRHDTNARTHGYKRLRDLIASYAASFDINRRNGKRWFVRMKDDEKLSELTNKEEEEKEEAPLLPKFKGIRPWWRLECDPNLSELTKKEKEKDKKEAPLLSKVKGIVVDLGGESSWVEVDQVGQELRCRHDTHASAHGYKRLRDLIASYASSFDIIRQKRQKWFVRIKDDEKPSELTNKEEEEKKDAHLLPKLKGISLETTISTVSTPDAHKTIL
jgi:hypothetical protein